ncbi:MAG: TadE family protein [Chloroflexota bacterium]
MIRRRRTAFTAWRGSRPGQRGRRAGERGQGLVEFALLLPVLMTMLLAMLEFGTAFNHQLTLGYAVREGARIGADLVNGGGTLGCNTGQSPNAANVDGVIIEAIDRVLSSSGSPVPASQVTRIRIYQADTAGGDTLGLHNDWIYSSTLYTLGDGNQVNFKPNSGVQTWGACNRSNVLGHTTTFSPTQIDSIGVAITYTYKFLSPLGSTLTMSDVAVMQFNPTTTSG